MALSLQYFDAYLAPLVTDEREARALADVDAIGEFPGEWRDRLAVARAYIVTAIESQRAPDDLFATKAKRYSEDFDRLLPLARAAATAATESVGAGSFLSIPLERA